MANIKSAEKRIRQDVKRRSRNRALSSRMRTAVKKVRLALEQGDHRTASENLPGALRTIDSTAQKGIIHRNTAARTKSRLVRAVRTSE
jgi:small subunit ribosomal protein S20